LRPLVAFRRHERSVNNDSPPEVRTNGTGPRTLRRDSWVR
jgi:hypothetical protein